MRPIWAVVYSMGTHTELVQMFDSPEERAAWIEANRQTIDDHLALDPLSHSVRADSRQESVDSMDESS